MSTLYKRIWIWTREPSLFSSFRTNENLKKTNLLQQQAIGNLFNSSVWFSHSNHNAVYLHPPRNVIVYTRKYCRPIPFHRNWSSGMTSTQQLPHAEISDIYCTYNAVKTTVFRALSRWPTWHAIAALRGVESQTLCAVRPSNHSSYQRQPALRQ